MTPMCPKCKSPLSETRIKTKLDGFTHSLRVTGVYVTCDCGYSRIDFDAPINRPAPLSRIERKPDSRY